MGEVATGVRVGGAEHPLPVDEQCLEGLRGAGWVAGLTAPVGGLWRVVRVWRCSRLSNRRQSARSSSTACAALVWEPARSRASIVSSFGQAALDVDAAASESGEAAAARFLAWLAATDRRWLVALDDLADAGDLGGLWPSAPQRCGRRW